MSSLHHALEQALRQREGNRRAAERRVGKQARQSPFQIPDARFKLACDEFANLVRQLYPFGLAFLRQDHPPGLEVGRSQLSDQSPMEALAQVGIQSRDLLGQAIARDHYLFLLFMQAIEDTEELSFRLFFPGDESNPETRAPQDYTQAFATHVRLAFKDADKSPSSGRSLRKPDANGR